MNKQTIELHISQLEVLRCEAAVRGDLEALQQMLDEQLMFVHSAGYVHNKPEYLEFLAEKIKVLEISRPEPLNYRFFGEAVVTCGSLDQLLQRRIDNSLLPIKAMVTQIWTRRGNDWKLLHFHSTRRS